MIASTIGRVPSNTAECVNEQIQEECRQRVAACAAEGRQAIDRRLAELDQEWDIERALETMAPTFSLSTFDEPPGSIVTPYSTSAASMVRFWWLTMSSCAVARNSATSARKRWRLTSSSAASTSSIT